LDANTVIKSPHERSPTATTLFFNGQGRICSFGTRRTLSSYADYTLPALVQNQSYIYVVIASGGNYILRLRPNVRITGHFNIAAGYQEQVVAAGEMYIFNGQLILFNLKSNTFGSKCVASGLWVNAMSQLFGASLLEKYFPEVDSIVEIDKEVALRKVMMSGGADVFTNYLATTNVLNIEHYRSNHGSRADLTVFFNAIHQVPQWPDPSVIDDSKISVVLSPKLPVSTGLKKFGTFAVPNLVEFKERPEPVDPPVNKRCCVIM